jgi:hypothetical protein
MPIFGGAPRKKFVQRFRAAVENTSREWRLDPDGRLAYF